MKHFGKGIGPLIVLGMHRSGTSLVSDWLHRSGLFLGDELYGASRFNRGGYFEDVDFIRLHEYVLSTLGQDPTGHEFPLERQSQPSLELSAYVAAFVDARRQNGPWGWKDPRSCLLLDLYRNSCPDACYLIVLRDFRPIVHSLIRRERVLQSRWAFLARGRVLNWILQRHYERKFTNYYLAVISKYFENLLNHLKICPDRCVVLDLDCFEESSEALASSLAKRGVVVKQVDVADVLRPGELSSCKDLGFASPLMLKQVMEQYSELKRMAV